MNDDQWTVYNKQHAVRIQQRENGAPKSQGKIRAQKKLDIYGPICKRVHKAPCFLTTVDVTRRRHTSHVDATRRRHTTSLDRFIFWLSHFFFFCFSCTTITVSSRFGWVYSIFFPANKYYFPAIFFSSFFPPINIISPRKFTQARPLIGERKERTVHTYT